MDDAPDEEKLRILEQLLASSQGAAPAASAAAAPTASGHQVAYEPGLCVKTRNAEGHKFFINLCQSPDLPVPPDASDAQLAQLLEDPDGHAARFRVPLSIGEPHAERDRAGAACTAFDVVAHPRLLERARESDLYRSFVLSMAVEGVEAKHGLSLSRDLTVLRNKKYVGSVQQQASQHFIRAGGPRPFIQEVPSSSGQAEAPAAADQLASRAAKKEPPRPEFRLMQEPPHGAPSHFVCEVALPLVASADTLQLQLGGDRLLLTCRSRAYRLDFYLPACIDQAACCAQFDTDSRLLSVTMPVEGS